MDRVKRTIIGISDIKNLFQDIKNKYSVDFTNYALSSLKRRVEVFLQKNFLYSVEELIQRIDKDPNFLDVLISSLLVPSTEMFRDPEFWNQLKNSLLVKYRHATELNIWLPDCNSGEELYSLLIILYQLDLFEKAKIYVTSISNSILDEISIATFDFKKLEIYQANYERFQEGRKLDDYLIKYPKTVQIKDELLSGVIFEKHNIVRDNYVGVFDIVLFRNKMLYYNPQLKNEVLNKMAKVLRSGGYLIVGVQEKVDYPGYDKDFKLFIKSEKIYKKVLL